MDYGSLYLVDSMHRSLGIRISVDIESCMLMTLL